MANAQLTLVQVDSEWKIDEETKRIGRAGLAQARAVLAETSAPFSLSLPEACETGARSSEVTDPVRLIEQPQLLAA